MKKHIGLVFCLTLLAAYISCTKKAEAEIKPSVKTAVEQSGIFSRKTSRVYDASKQISDSDLQLILKAAFASPTADNSRAAEFIVVQYRNKIINLKEGNPYASQLNTAPTVIVIAVNEKTIVHNDLAALDAGIAAQSIMIQAAELGYASVPMSIAPQETRVKNTRSVLGLPNYVTPYIMVVVGFPAADAVTSASTDYWNDSKVHKNGW